MKKKYLVFAILWSCLIVLSCALPGKKIPHFSFMDLLSFDKLIHAFIYFVYTHLWFRAITRDVSTPYLNHFAAGIAITTGILLGILIEVLQATVLIDRSGEVLDAVANSIGSLTAYLLIKRKLKLKRS